MEKRSRRAAMASAAVGAALSVGFGTSACTSSGTLTFGSGGAGINGASSSGPGGAAQDSPFDFVPSTPAPASSVDASDTATKITPALVVVESTLGLQHAEAQGTGIVLTADGRILTNNHVIAGATAIKVIDQGDGNSYTATVIGFDRAEDVAVLQLANAHGLTTAPLSTGTPKTGDAIVAVGNAGGTGTLTDAAGKVTALNQKITATDEGTGSSEQLKGLIGVDADIQPGDSGGPLVNDNGQVIGIDTAANSNYRFQQSGGASAGYAIPIAAAAAIAKDIVDGKTTDVIHIGPSAVMGVSVSSSSDQPGAQVEGVVAGSAAEKGGLTQGDVITSLDGTDVVSATTLTQLMDKRAPGQTVTVGFMDTSGANQTVKIVLGTGPAG